MIYLGDIFKELPSNLLYLGLDLLFRPKLQRRIVLGKSIT